MILGTPRLSSATISSITLINPPINRDGDMPTTSATHDDGAHGKVVYLQLDTYVPVGPRLENGRRHEIVRPDLFVIQPASEPGGRQDPGSIESNQHTHTNAQKMSFV